MNKKIRTLAWMTLALLTGTSVLPAEVLAHPHEGQGHRRHHHHHHQHRYPEEVAQRRYWDQGRHRHWVDDRRVVMVRDPPVVRHPPAVVTPLWANGITILLQGDW